MPDDMPDDVPEDVTDDWDELAATYDEQADHGLRDPVVRAAWRDLLLPLIPEGATTAADIACGTGSLSLLLAEAGLAVSGIDRSARMLALADRKTAAAEPRPVFAPGDAADPPLQAGAFDVVLARHILFMLPEPERVIERWVALLRPGGVLVLVEGFWGTGAGLRSEETLALVHPHRPVVHLHQLAEHPSLWGKEVDDERYLVHSPS